MSGASAERLDPGPPPATPPATPPFRLERPLAAAADEAQVEVARLLLQRGALPNGRDGRSWLPLVGAVRSGDPEMVGILLDAGADPRAKPAGDFTLVEYVRGPCAQEILDLLERSRSAKGPGTRRRTR